MLRRILCKDLYVDAGGRHVGRFHFSYGDYFDLSNGPFGVLEALNDFLVEPGGGFGAHPHEETEIISYCVEGELSHSDTEGNTELLRRGDVGHQCAGSGIIHAEENLSPDARLHFVQTLIKPNAPNLTPGYSSRRFSAHDRRSKWLQIVSGRPISDTIRINQDADVFVSEVDQGTRLGLAVPSGRQAYLVCLEGSIAIGGLEIGDNDAIRATGEAELSLEALEDAHLLLVEVAESE